MLGAVAGINYLHAHLVFCYIIIFLLALHDPRQVQSEIEIVKKACEYMFMHTSRLVIFSLIPSLCPQTHTHENIQPSSNSSISPFTHIHTDLQYLLYLPAYLHIYQQTKSSN